MANSASYLPDIQDLPLILAGPILRRTESDRVTVWLALKESRLLELEIYDTQEGKGAVLDKILLKGRSKTIALGQNLHIVAITARPITQEKLEPDRVYAYNIYSDSDRYNLLDDIATDNYGLSYFSHQLPTFALPPSDLNHLKIVHGSCRKPSGGGRDMLSCLDNLIAVSAHSPSDRPHQLFLTGDQIYGDDLADPILWLAQQVDRLLFGWSEELPLQQTTILARDIPPGKRSEIARIEAGFTAMLPNKPEKAKSHLFSFGEYAACYLLSWSPVLMKDYFPSRKSLFNNKKRAKSWDKELAKTNSFIRDLHLVRRALANIPLYTICDDHDISDDWYLNREWCERVLSKPLGKRIIQNGLLAYSLFQAWGNTPELFEADRPGERLLELASGWFASQGQDSFAKTECDRYLGIPNLDRSTGLPQLERDEDVLILARDRQAIPWHYTISNDNHEVIVLDTRTWRGYPSGEDRGLEPPMLLCPLAFKQQLHNPLENSHPNIEATLLVLPTNLVALKIIDRIQQFALSRNRVFSTDVGDSWNFHQEAFAQFILSISQRRKRVIILSGDIHYSCAVRITHWSHNTSDATSIIVQLTSSAIKNSELATRIVHTKLKSLFPEKTERWLVWEKPLKLTKITPSRWWHKNNYLDKQSSLPDWQYRIEWCKREPAELLPWKSQSPIIEQKLNFWQKAIALLLSLLWRNRWLQEGTEVIGRNNLGLVKFQWSTTKAVIQENYWHPPWQNTATVKTRYKVSLEPDSLPSSVERKIKQ